MKKGHVSMSGIASRHIRTLILLLVDSMALLTSIIASHLLRYENTPWHEILNNRISTHYSSLPAAIGLYLVIFAVFHLYNYAWRYASLETLLHIVGANTVGLTCMAALQIILDGSTFSSSVLVIMWAASITLIGASRIALRVVSVVRRSGCQSLRVTFRKTDRKRAVIIGAGNCGARTLRAIQSDPSLKYDVVGFLDDDPKKLGIYMSHARVLGPLKMVNELALKRAVDEVIVAIPEVGRNGAHRCIMDCKRLKVPVKVIPHLRDVLNGSKTTSLADFSVEDLLRRAPADTITADIDKTLTGSRVLVTGAGGSIGSELCRQIAVCNPASLVLIGHGENSIHNIHKELVEEFPQISDRFECVIASTANQSRIDHVFKYHRPEVVFHAAAHKHVPLMESNEQEAVNNNMLGTYNVAAASGEHGVKRIVLISTDKAADPSCIMGATKWFCEEVFRCGASLWPSTSYIAVRFGNVLGSRGSVVPVFHEQIRRGGPVLVTHPEMTRFFMTIREAVRLVLEAGAVGKSGQLYVLDMGKPVKILDLAKDMIRLCGLEPDVDIAIDFTGIRPGEKIHEQLISSQETIERTPWSGLVVVNRKAHFEYNKILGVIDGIRHTVDHDGDAVVRKMLSTMMPKTRMDYPPAQTQAHKGEHKRLKVEG
ncbi:polysaccharide biosynthesis protein [bacterium]|nr:polysaccharide biosynthesis protein [bacterium]